MCPTDSVALIRPGVGHCPSFRELGPRTPSTQLLEFWTMVSSIGVGSPTPFSHGVLCW